MVSVCAQHNIHTHIDSNLTAREFSDEESEAIVKSGLSSLFASIDGVTQETYEKYRVHGNLNRALNNLRQLVKAKERLHMSTPQIGWAFYIHRFNEHEVDQAREVAKDIGINIWFKLLSADPSWYSSFHYQWNEILAFPKWAKRAFPIPIDPRLAERTFHKDVTEVCKQLFFTMIVGWNGDVVPCCSVSGDEYKIGNLLEDSLEVVWNNIEFRACRKFISNFGRIKNTTNSVCENLPCNLSKKQKYDAQYIGSLLKEKEATLSNIYKSRGWKALLTYYKLRDKVLRFKSKL
jgi:radical SAM protein with 4Fe4S-binding SPASM domain